MIARLLAVLFLCAPAPRQEPAKPTPEALEFFEKKVRPVLVEKCYSCHSAEAKKLKGGLRLDSREAILKGGDAGASIVPGDAAKSLLVKAVRYIDPDLQMPPKEKLPAAVMEDFARWVMMGAPWPAGEAAKPVAAKSGGMEITAADREYWAYRAVKRPAAPRVRDAAWVRSPIDAFILEKLEAKGLAPAAPAPRAALIRRATYDLTGLPPSTEEVEAFVADPAPDAYEKLIDRLLASPHYGEKWGRHWLDLVRFAETNGYERDGDKPNAWRYRDYVIRAFNEDKPYDLFVREQLAGDEFDPPTPDAIVATGYYRLGLVDDEPADRDLARYDGLDSILSTTSQAMLAMTVGCARCHDHKKDPIPQEDYYRLLAFIHGVNPLDRDGPGAEAVLVRDEEGHKVFDEKMKALQEEEARLKKEKAPGAEAVRKKMEELKKHLPKDQKTLSVSEPLKGQDTFLLRRGNPKVPGDKVSAGFPKVLGFPEPDLSAAPKGRATTGRRTLLANWIANPANPLTTRVLANRLWQFHFGRGIVPTPNDFGKLGDPPTHPELLDWLASEVVARGWKLKDLHRLLMTTAAYRMSSTAGPAQLAKDPANELWSRFGMRRLTAEELRDSVLSANGTLNLKMGGPSIFVPLPREVIETSSTPKSAWGVSTAEEARRRSVYIKVKRSILVPILAAHDFADTDSSCAVRFATTVPTQALTLMNSAFMNEQAAVFARRLEAEAPGDLAAQVRKGLRAVTQRAPSETEVARGVKLAAGESLAVFCLMALNLNEFIYLD